MYVSDREENIVGKGENAVYQHFLIFPPCFQKSSFVEPCKRGIVSEKVNASRIYIVQSPLVL